MLLALGILGLVGVAPVGAQTQVKLFGKTYNVTKERRDQEFKKQGGGTVKIAIVPRDVGAQHATISFAPGADAAGDRLFVGCNIPPDGTLAHQFYQLRGTDANGVFTKDAATVTEYFGGAVDMNRGGRPTGHMWINDNNTGVGTDRNIAISTFWNDDYFRVYDFDKMTGVAGDNEEGLNSDAVYSILLTDTDNNSPGTSLTCYAHLPQHDGKSLVVFGLSANGGTGCTVWDTTKNAMHPIVTDFQTVTASSTKPFPEAYRATAAAQYSGDEYWLLTHESDPAPTTAATTSDMLIRARLTFPADMTKAAPDSIKVEVLETQELKGSGLHAVSDTGEGMVLGFAKGREVAPGLYRLYFSDSEGNIYTANPVP
jgi:hypothetical protein